jgi:hypothetical protein
LPCFQFYDFSFCPLYCLAFNSTTFSFVHCIVLLSILRLLIISLVSSKCSYYIACVNVNINVINLHWFHMSYMYS